ncbi:hypothetical protein CAPTEDRAFT_212942 [Capitella teleta]|uniref:Uncharacterized protein n=1 Tax=Capitella teleta TaxID=283909 RepID=R7TKH7_CAPTE|nr:hypothetical protein CAPTEDRAFT_212942 [Capitella teleta]|eukprot:ELT92051.1 hypothetical protein CAPTEDRAFT_212942 [Capitella teleta]
MRDRWRDEYQAVKSAAHPRSAKYKPKINSPITRPHTAPELISIDGLGNPLTRLTRPNTSTGTKAVLWSSPRKWWQEHYTTTSLMYVGDGHRKRYCKLQKHFPGLWKFVERYKAQAWAADIGNQEKLRAKEQHVKAPCRQPQPTEVPRKRVRIAKQVTCYV